MSVDYCQKVGECGNDFNTSKGFITSPSYPDIYPPSTTCIYTISHPVGTHIQLRFQSLGLEICKNICVISWSPTCRSLPKRARRRCSWPPGTASRRWRPCSPASRRTPTLRPRRGRCGTWGTIQYDFEKGTKSVTIIITKNILKTLHHHRDEGESPLPVLSRHFQFYRTKMHFEYWLSWQQN